MLCSVLVNFGYVIKTNCISNTAEHVNAKTAEKS